MKREMVFLRHPTHGKRGTRIDRAKYELVRAAIIQCLEAKSRLTFDELLAAVAEILPLEFEGDPNWYTTWVKLDLEAHRKIRRVPHSHIQHLELTRRRPQTRRRR